MLAHEQKVDYIFVSIHPFIFVIMLSFFCRIVFRCQVLWMVLLAGLFNHSMLVQAQENTWKKIATYGISLALCSQRVESITLWEDLTYQLELTQVERLGSYPLDAPLTYTSIQTFGKENHPFLLQEYNHTAYIRDLWNRTNSDASWIPVTEQRHGVPIKPVCIDCGDFLACIYQSEEKSKFIRLNDSFAWIDQGRLLDSQNATNQTNPTMVCHSDGRVRALWSGYDPYFLHGFLYSKVFHPENASLQEEWDIQVFSLSGGAHGFAPISLSYQETNTFAAAWRVDSPFHSGGSIEGELFNVDGEPKGLSLYLADFSGRTRMDYALLDFGQTIGGIIYCCMDASHICLERFNTSSGSVLSHDILALEEEEKYAPRLVKLISSTYLLSWRNNEGMKVAVLNASLAQQKDAFLLFEGDTISQQWSPSFLLTKEGRVRVLGQGANATDKWIELVDLFLMVKNQTAFPSMTPSTFSAKAPSQLLTLSPSVAPSFFSFPNTTGFKGPIIQLGGKKYKETFPVWTRVTFLVASVGFIVGGGCCYYHVRKHQIQEEPILLSHKDNEKSVLSGTSEYVQSLNRMIIRRLEQAYSSPPPEKKAVHEMPSIIEENKTAMATSLVRES